MPQLIFETTMASYFHERLYELGKELKSPPHEDTLYYMGALLARFGQSEQLFSYDEGGVNIRPLALLYKDAYEASAHRERCLILRQLGDLALFLGALFPQRFYRRGLSTNYVVGMGGGAYDYLASNADQNRHIFSELASTFAHMLKLIAQVCDKQKQFGDDDVLELYKRWCSSGDPYAAERLLALGVNLHESDWSH